MKSLFLGGACVFFLALPSCTFLPVFPGDPPGFASSGAASAEGQERFPNWPLEPHELERHLRSTVETDRVELAGGGTTGVERVSLYVPGREGTVDFKWKSMTRSNWFDFFPSVPGLLDGVNNSPRKEVAAWRLQQLFLDPEDYVVPETAIICPRLSMVRRFTPGAEPQLEGSQCQLGMIALWLTDVTVPEELPDLDRFRSDPVYAHYVANLNLLTYLIKHHDGREGNFLIAKDDARPQVFSIDNGVAFGGPWYNWFVTNWSKLRVPALRAESIDRLRNLTEADLQRALGVVAELRLEDDGIYRNVKLGPNLDEEAGVRLESGTLQLGLTEEEIEDVWERLEDLVEDVDEGDLAVF